MVDVRTVGRVVIATVAYYVLSVGALHFLRADIDPLAIPVSAYVGGAYGELMTSTYFVLAIGLCGIVVGLRQLLEASVRSRVGFVLMSIAALGVAAAGAFPAEPPPAITLTGRLHAISSIVFFVPVTVAVILLSLSIRRAARWREIAGLVTTLAAGVTLPFVLLPVVVRLNVAGLAQRVAFAFLFAWMAVVAYRMLKVKDLSVSGRQV